MESNRRKRERRRRRLQRCSLAAADSQTTRSHSFFIFSLYEVCCCAFVCVTYSYCHIHTQEANTSLHTQEAYLLHVHWGARQKQKLQLRRASKRRRKASRRRASRREVFFFLVGGWVWLHTHIHAYIQIHACIHTCMQEWCLLARLLVHTTPHDMDARRRRSCLLANDMLTTKSPGGNK